MTVQQQMTYDEVVVKLEEYANMNGTLLQATTAYQIRMAEQEVEIHRLMQVINDLEDEGVV